MELPKDIKDEIWGYCRINDITGVNDFIIKMVKQGFTSEKFGPTPWDKPAEVVEKVVEKIVEKEIIKEVPVEVIKEIIKEVPVEVIKEVIKEVSVEKEVFVTDDEANLKLKDTINVLEQQQQSLSDKLSEVSKLSSDRGKELKKQGETITSLRETNEDLVNDIDKELKKINTLIEKNKKLEIKLTQVKLELEEENNKQIEVKKDDIYGETKKGFFGSNVSDVWKKKK